MLGVLKKRPSKPGQYSPDVTFGLCKLVSVKAEMTVCGGAETYSVESCHPFDLKRLIVGMSSFPLCVLGAECAYRSQISGKTICLTNISAFWCIPDYRFQPKTVVLSQYCRPSSGGFWISQVAFCRYASTGCNFVKL